MRQFLCVGDEVREEFQGGLSEPFAVFVGGVVPMFPVGEPTFAGCRGDEVVPDGVSKCVLEGQMVHLPVTGKEGMQSLPEQSPGLLKDELEFLDGGCLEDVVEGMANLEFLKLRKGFLQGMDASDEGVRVDGYGCNP